MKIIFLISNKGFPILKEGRRYEPRLCIDGFIFEDTPTKREICEELGLTYTIKDFFDITFPEPPPEPEEL